MVIKLLLVFAAIVQASTASNEEPNIALKKPVYQSSTGWGGRPEKATDGNVRTYSHTVHNRKESYVVIDLQAAYFVKYVRILERSRGPHGFFSLLVSNYFDPKDKKTGVKNFHVCGEQRQVKDIRAFVKVPCNRFGRYVAIERFDRNKYLIISEMQVYGTETGSLTYNQEPKEQVNIFKRKKVVNLNKRMDRSFRILTDGQYRRCIYMTKRYFPIIVDMGGIFVNPKVDIHMRRGTAQKFNLAIGDVFPTCQRNLVKEFRACGDTTDKRAGICNGTGRFLSINIPLKSRNNRVLICEITAVGREIYTHRNIDLLPYESTCVVQDNLALGKPTYQLGEAYGGKSGRAVDKNANGYYNARHCSKTSTSDNAWWVVDLEGYFDVSAVKIWPRTDTKDFSEFTVSFGLEFRPCASAMFAQFNECHRQETDLGGDPLITDCRGFARYVAVRRHAKRRKSLDICEMEVFGSLIAQDVNKIKPWRNSCSLEKEHNIAIGKSFYDSSGESIGKIIADGNLWSFAKIPEDRTGSWILVDLQGMAEVSFIRLHNVRGMGVNNIFEVLLGKYWSPCSSAGLDSFISGGKLIQINPQMFELALRGHNARFIAIRDDSRYTVFIGELEIFSSGKITSLTEREMRAWKGECTVQTAANSEAPTNFAYDKHVHLSTGKDGNMIVDGSPYTCTHLPSDGWVVLDLQKVVDVATVKLWQSKRWYVKPFSNIEVRVLSSFNPCLPEFENQGVLCAPVQNVGNSIEVVLVNCRATGQYIAVRKHTIDNNKLPFCEMEVYGKQTLQKPITPVPFPRLTGTNSFNSTLMSKMLRGVHSWHQQPQATKVIPVLEHSSSVLVTSDENADTVIASSTLGKGKLLISGDDRHLNDMWKQEHPLMKNLAKWLVGEATPRFYNVKHVIQKQSEMQSPGAIITWRMYYNASKETADLVRDLVASGKAGLFLAAKSWTMRSRLESYSCYTILRDSGVILSSKIVNWSPETWNFSLVPPLIHSLPVSRKLDLLLVSTNAFLKFGSQVVSDVNSLPNNLQKAIEAADKQLRLLDIYQQYVEQNYTCGLRQTWLPDDKALMTTVSQILLSQTLAFSNRRAPGVDVYPGILPRGADTKDVTIEFVATVAHEHHATGLYLPPGGTLEIEPHDATSEKELPKWSVRVGCHTDDISRSKRETWYRFPLISVSTTVTNRKIYSGFGGLVWILNNKANSRIKLTLKGAAKAPYFNLRDPQSIAKWNEEGRTAPGPWAEIAGDMMVLSVEAKRIREMTSSELKALMSEVWDQVVKQDHHLRGTNWKTSRRERFVVDVQISAGSGHAGYPMMAMLYWTRDFLSKDINDKNVDWGSCHEIGHNMQRGVWTYGGTGEVTNNLFCLYNRYMKGQTFYRGFDVFESRKDTIKRHLKAPTFKSWKGDSFLALTIYGQLANSFGFTLYKKAYRKYFIDNINPKNDSDKIQIWIQVVSKSAGYNLVPMFDFWGFPIDQSTRKKLTNMTAYLPQDFITELAPERVGQIIARYPGLVRKVTRVTENWENELREMSSLLPNDVKVL